MRRKYLHGMLAAGLAAFALSPAEAMLEPTSDQHYLLVQRKKSLSQDIRKLETKINIARKKLEQDRDVIQARQNMQASIDTYQKLTGKRRQASSAELAEAKKRINEASHAYQTLIDKKLNDNPDTASLMEKSEHYRTEHKRITTLLQLYAEQRASAPLPKSAADKKP